MQLRNMSHNLVLERESYTVPEDSKYKLTYGEKNIVVEVLQHERKTESLFLSCKK
ncbi:Uncharacterised protein [uncultured Bacteroides sp.]|nr:Uncharacterised protein [uncultured Bacteroides sp.]